MRWGGCSSSNFFSRFAATCARFCITALAIGRISSRTAQCLLRLYMAQLRAKRAELMAVMNELRGAGYLKIGLVGLETVAPR